MVLHVEDMKVGEESNVAHPREYQVRLQRPGAKWIRKKKEKQYV
jgi:hypothetical protein